MTAPKARSDEETIRRVLYRFYQALNERDWTTMRSLMDESFEVHIQEDTTATSEGGLRLTGEGFIDLLSMLSSHARETQHLLTSLIVDVDGPRACVSLLQYGVHIFHLADGSRKRGDSGGLCRFDMAKTEAGWKISSQQFKGYFTDPGYMDLLRQQGFPN